MIYVLVAILVVWLVCCGYAGYHKRFILFAGVALGGMGLNGLWMYFGFNAHPLSPPAVTAQAAVVMYAFSALGIGWFAGRMVRGFRESRVDPT